MKESWLSRHNSTPSQLSVNRSAFLASVFFFVESGGRAHDPEGPSRLHQTRPIGDRFVLSSFVSGPPRSCPRCWRSSNEHERRELLPSQSIRFNSEWMFSPLTSTTKFPKTLPSPFSPFLHPPIISQLIATKSLSQPLPWKCSHRGWHVPYIHNSSWTLTLSSFYSNAIWNVTLLFVFSFTSSLFADSIFVNSPTLTFFCNLE